MNVYGKPEGSKEFRFQYTNDVESYVCPYCLYDIDECKCDEIPLSINRIETWSRTIQRKFREKGFGVYFAGASNTYVEDSPLLIGFQMYTKYKFENKIPKGWKYNSNGFLIYSMKSNNTKDLISERDIELEKLAAWIDTLPEHPEWKVVKSHSDIVSV